MVNEGEPKPIPESQVVGFTEKKRKKKEPFKRAKPAKFCIPDEVKDKIVEGELLGQGTPPPVEPEPEKPKEENGNLE